MLNVFFVASLLGYDCLNVLRWALCLSDLSTCLRVDLRINHIANIVEQFALLIYHILNPKIMIPPILILI